MKKYEQMSWKWNEKKRSCTKSIESFEKNEINFTNIAFHFVCFEI